jgi:uncharacterized OsmC-like protein
LVGAVQREVGALLVEVESLVDAHAGSADEASQVALCQRRGTKEGKIDRIELDIEFAGPLSSEQRSKLLEIAKKCPVHRTLTSETNIRITAA